MAMARPVIPLAVIAVILAGMFLIALIHDATLYDEALESAVASAQSPGGDADQADRMQALEDQWQRIEVSVVCEEAD